MANTKKDKPALIDGFLEGIDILNVLNTTSKQQALNDLADFEPSFGEKLGQVVGGTLATGVVGATIGAAIAFFGASLMPAVLIGAGVAGLAGGIGEFIEANKQEETYTPKETEKDTK